MKKTLVLILLTVVPFMANADGINRYVDSNGDILTAVKGQSELLRNYEATGNPISSVPNFFLVQLDNKSGLAYTALQFDLVLPHGVSAVNQVAKYSSTAKSDDVVLTFGYAAKADAEACAYYSKVTQNSAYDANDDHLVLSSLLDATADGRQVVRVVIYSPSNKSLLTTSGAKDVALIFVNPNAYAKAGTNGVEFTNVEFCATDRATFEATVNPVDAEVTKAFSVQSEAEVPLNISATDKFAAIILPFSATPPEGVKAYAVSGYTPVNNEECELGLYEMRGIEAYRPYILFAENGINTVLSGTVDAEAYKTEVSEDILTGCIVPKTVSVGYILQNQSDMHAFCAIDEGTPQAIAAGQCYIKGSSSVKRFSLPSSDQLLGIDAVKSGIVNDNVPVFDLQGRRTQLKGHGIYIVGQKKIVR